MGKPAVWLWSELGEAFRGRLKSFDLAMFAARLVAWHLVPKSVQLSTELAAPAPGDNISSGQLRDAWERLADEKTLGDRRYAFEDAVSFPYEQLSDAVISKANQLLGSVILFETKDRLALADELIGVLLGPSRLNAVGLPLEVAELVIRLVKPNRGERVFCPGPAADSLAVATIKHECVPVIVSGLAPIAACLYALISRRELTVVREDPYRPGAMRTVAPNGFDVGAVQPPFGMKLGNVEKLGWIPSQFGVRSSEALGVELALRYVHDRFAAVVPNSFLFSSGPDKALREHLINEGILTAVVSFPSGLLANTNLPFTVLLLTPGARTREVALCKVDETVHLTGSGKVRARDRRFTGADAVLQLLKEPDGTFSLAVKNRAIQEQDFALSPDRYLVRPSIQLADSSRHMVSLGDLVAIVKPQFLKPDEGPKGVEIQEAIPSDMPKHGYLQRVERVRRVDARLFRSRYKQRLEKDDVLLSTKGTIGNVAIARPDPSSGIPLLPSQASVILKLSKDGPIVDPRYLVIYLRSPVVQKTLAALATGATIQNISLGDLRALPVWVPSAEKQRALVRVFEEQAAAQEEIEALEKKQRDLAGAAWTEAGLSETA